MTRVLLIVMALVATAAAKPPTVVTAFNAIDKAHAVKQVGATWKTANDLAATVDVRNGYLTFTDPKAKETTTAALWKASNGRWFLGVTDSAPAMSYWEVDSADDTPEEVQPSPLPYLAIGDLLAPEADAKLVEANAKELPTGIELRYELPRKGTTLIARVDVAALHQSIAATKLPAATKAKIQDLVDHSMFTRIELAFDDGRFSIKRTSK